MYCFLVEKCILNCLNDHNEICPLHGSMSPRFMMSQDGVARTLYIAPEILFSDLDTSILIGPADTLTLVKLVGKGAFGEVYQGKLRKVCKLVNQSSVFSFHYRNLKKWNAEYLSWFTIRKSYYLLIKHTSNYNFFVFISNVKQFFKLIFNFLCRLMNLSRMLLLKCYVDRSKMHHYNQR